MRPAIEGGGNLVYTVAFGQPEYLELAELMFASLRATGWRGRAVCLTDRLYAFKAALEVEVAPLSSSSGMWKGALPAVVNCASFENILYVDTDVLFVRNPTEFLSRPFKRPQVAQVGLRLERSRFNTMYFSRQERAEIPHDTMTINTGAVVMPGNQAARFLAAWGDFHAQVSRRSEEARSFRTIHDQPALEALMFRGHVQADRMPLGTMSLPAHGREVDVDGATLFAHYVGFDRSADGKDACKRQMKEELARRR